MTSAANDRNHQYHNYHAQSSFELSVVKAKPRIQSGQSQRLRTGSPLKLELIKTGSKFMKLMWNASKACEQVDMVLVLLLSGASRLAWKRRLKTALNTIITDYTYNDMRITHFYLSFRCFELGSLAAELRIQWPDGKWLEFRVYLPSATKITIELTASDALSRLLGKAVKPAQPKIKSISQCSICVTGWTANDCLLGCEKPQGQ